MLSTEFSLSRPMPPNSSWELPRDQRRPAGEVGVEALDAAVVERQHVVLDRLDQEQRCSSASLLGFSAARSWAWVQSSGVVELPHVVVEGGQLGADISQGVLCG